MSQTAEKAVALIKRLREKPSTYNRELLDEAADTIEALLKEREILRGIAVWCGTCKHVCVSLSAEPCRRCYGHSRWEAEGGES